MKFEATEQATTWLTGRVSDLKAELETAEAKVKAFNAATKLISPEALKGMNRQIKDLRDRVAETEVAAGVALTRLEELSAARKTAVTETMVEAANDPHLGVDILIGEKPKINAADLYASERFEAFLHEMRGHYDMIIIDTPPVLVVPDARVIGQFVDAIIYSVKWDDTPKSQVKEGINLLESVGLKVTGLVLSQVDPKGMKRYGYGGYGGYNGYSNSYKGYYEN